MGDFNRHIISAEADLRSALSAMNSLQGGSLTLFVENNDYKVVGTLTDGDIRRGLLSGLSLDSQVREVMHLDFLYLADSVDSLQIVEKARERGVWLLPFLDNSGRLIDVIDLRHTHSVLTLDAVLMAGGKGLRMRPLTLDTPKPLLPVGGRPIIDYNVDLLHSYGVKNIFVTVNYKREMVEQHFISAPHIACIPEPTPLGTFGSLTLIERLSHDNLIVMNADLFTDINFESMYRRHIETKADLTIAAVPYTVSVPYAIMHTNPDHTINSIEEKPTYNYFANAGVYILRRELISLMKKGERLDAPDFIELLLTEKRKVAYYPIEGMWTDIGSPDDYRHVCDLMSRTSGR